MVGSARTDNSRIAPSYVDDCTYFSIKSSRLIGADVPDLFLGTPRLGCADLTCSLLIMLVMEVAIKEKKGLEYFYFFYLVDLLKSLVATAYVDCTACAPCKRLCVEYTTFAHKTTYCVHIVQLLHVSDLLHTYTTCALEATCAYDVRLVRVKRLIAYV